MYAQHHAACQYLRAIPALYREKTEVNRYEGAKRHWRNDEQHGRYDRKPYKTRMGCFSDDLATKCSLLLLSGSASGIRCRISAPASAGCWQRIIRCLHPISYSKYIQRAVAVFSPIFVPRLPSTSILHTLPNPRGTVDRAKPARFRCRQQVFPGLFHAPTNKHSCHKGTSIMWAGRLSRLPCAALLAARF